MFKNIIINSTAEQLIYPGTNPIHPRTSCLNSCTYLYKSCTLPNAYTLIHTFTSKLEHPSTK